MTYHCLRELCVTQTCQSSRFDIVPFSNGKYSDKIVRRTTGVCSYVQKHVIDSSHSTDSYFLLEYRSAILMVKNQ